MGAIADFIGWLGVRLVAFAKALNRALATPPNEGLAHPHDDTVFQPRDL